MSVDFHEAKNQFSKLVQRAADGEEIVIAKAGVPMAKLVPFVETRKPRRPGAWKGKVRISDDVDELPDDLAAAFRGERP